jgi:hypothetical protein
MRALPSPLRKQLETAVLSARRTAESACRAAIGGLGVFLDRRPDHLDASQAALRNGLRAKWRQLGGDRELLVAECAYEQWHRLLFARFLAENNLLLHPSFKAPVTLTDCDDLAAELGEPDAWSVAARFAAEILPGIFRLDDPCVRLRLAPEGRHALEQILDAIQSETFLADDALGWVYQFWQKDKKDEVNASERKIGGADIGPVTQLFTENYMVRFLLENSLGAWWAARHPESALVEDFDYLRVDDGRPAAGSFDGWPDRVAEVTVMDPCCGSGHFLVEAFSMLWQMRAEEESRSPVDAQDAVLRDNLFGLELDPRCVQIAMFAVALQAWKAGGGWRQLPVPNVACSGIPVKAPVAEWKALANGDERLENALVRLHILFREADTLGSLIEPIRAAEISDPTTLQTSTNDVDWKDIAPSLGRVLLRETIDSAASVLEADAGGLLRAAVLLSRRYTLVATNVPYLGRSKQSETLRSHVDRYFSAGSADLGTSFVDRFGTWANVWAVVISRNWLIASSFRELRRRLRDNDSVALVADIGSRGFSESLYEFPVVLMITESRKLQTKLLVARCGNPRSAEATENSLRHGAPEAVDSPWAPEPGVELSLHEQAPSALRDFATSVQGLKSGDNPRFLREFWEIPTLDDRRWRRLLAPVNSTTPYGGRSGCVDWREGRGPLATSPQARIQGQSAWGKAGVFVREIGPHPATLYTGELFESSGIVVIPSTPRDVDAVWAYLSDPEFAIELKKVDPKTGVATSSVIKVPFDSDHWRRVAEAAGPLPDPWSDDPTQWLFAGRPKVSTAPLQVAVARLLGFCWPQQSESDDLDRFVDGDGIVCLPAVAGQARGADRLQQVLAAAFGKEWSPAKVKELLTLAGSKKHNLADWLRDEFFKQHCAMFGNRPFVWHVWDGERDGFSALVNYHRLDRKTLQKLTYSYLGQDWVERQRAEVHDEIVGAEGRLSRALQLQRKLEAILEGEEPFDIYVRWKAQQEQPIGWDPDLNDGVRLNIRPFVEANVLRSPFNIHWKKDRGSDPDGGERRNDMHLSLGEKLKARKPGGRA